MPVGQQFESASTSATNSLSNATIINATLLDHKSTFKIPLGVRIHGLPSTEATKMGELFTYTISPEMQSSVPMLLYEAKADAQEGDFSLLLVNPPCEPSL